MPGKSLNNEETTALSRARQEGDRSRIERLLNEHRNYLRKVVQIRMDPRLARRVDVSDVVQEAQMEAVRRLDDYLRNPALPLKLWLRKLASERLIMEQRRHVYAEKRSVGREYRPDRSSIDIAKQLLAGIKSPSRQVTAQETAYRLHKILDELRAKDREIIVLHLFEGLTNQESAMVLDIEPAAARKRFGRALARLRERLAEMNLGDSSI
jgi:RNA polymerase sigma-70 factor (subfamily 1)